mmetsp:Transcript_19526/g.32550  ORF Transcript_19526/g.32550 Transcript_19526/m.32550 type:complete len:294 (-) Transcript_19526:44-925(-)
MAGFCINGPQCKFGHPKFELPKDDTGVTRVRAVVCHKCGQEGHKAYACPQAIIVGPQSASMPLQSSMSDDHPRPPSQPPSLPHRPPMPPPATPAIRTIPVHDSTSPVDSPVSATLPAQVMPGTGAPVPGRGRGLPAHVPQPGEPGFAPRPLDSVRCFKCGALGHYANRCPNPRRYADPRYTGGYNGPIEESAQGMEVEAASTVPSAVPDHHPPPPPPPPPLVPATHVVPSAPLSRPPMPVPAMDFDYSRGDFFEEQPPPPYWGHPMPPRSPFFRPPMPPPMYRRPPGPPNFYY